MAEVNPFRGLRYRLSNARLKKVLAPPYDVISKVQKRQLQASDPLNVIRLILGNPSQAPHKASDYLSAKRTLAAWRKKGVLARDPAPAFYVYQQVFRDGGRTHRRTGFIGHSKLTPFGKAKGGILAHEHTLAGPKADRLKLTKACRANFSCIFSLYPDRAGVGRILTGIVKRRPSVGVEYPQGVRNLFWPVTDPKTLEAIRSRMKGETLFIADGHHRYETALAYQAFRSGAGKGKAGTRPFDHVMMMFVSMKDPGLVILPTHRMLSKKTVGHPEFLLSRLSSLGELRPCPRPMSGSAPWEWLAKVGAKSPVLGVSFDGRKLYALRFPGSVGKSGFLKGLSKAQKGLDVTLLHRLILEPFFGITKEKVEHEIVFTSKAEEAAQRLRKGEFGAVFFLNPTRIGQLRDVAQAGERMPQKSTYFYPKLVTGLVFNDLDSF